MLRSWRGCQPKLAAAIPYTFDESDFVERFGVETGCAEGTRRAAPPVRIRDAVAAFAPWELDLVSSCADPWLRALACLPNAEPERTTTLCLDTDPFDEPVSLEGLASSCVATLDGTRLAQCTQESEPPPGESACVRWSLEGDRCDAQATVIRRQAPFASSCADVTCATEF